MRTIYVDAEKKLVVLLTDESCKPLTLALSSTLNHLSLLLLGSFRFISNDYTVTQESNQLRREPCKCLEPLFKDNMKDNRDNL